MFGGRGGDMDPRKMKKMMDQMGIDFDEIEDVEEVVIKTPTKELVFDAPQVNKMGAQGQETYQVVGEPTEKQRISQEDIEIVAERADVDEDAAREALKETDGDLTEAISNLE